MKATRSFGRLVALVLALAALAVTAGSAQATGGGGGEKRSDEAKAEASEKARGEAKVTVAASVKAEAKAKAETKAAAKASANTSAGAAAKAAQRSEAAAKAQAKVAAKAQVKTQASASQQTTVTATGAAPNQGEASKVLTVNAGACATPVAGAKVEGGLGATISVSSTLPIAKVTVKSGQGAAVVSSSFAADFKSGTITLSKAVSNYVVWTCGAAAAVQPTVDAGGKGKDKDDNSQGASNGRSDEAQVHVIVCHRTGSDSNPYVVINIPMTAWTEGHTKHPPKNRRSDILLKNPASGPGSKDGFTKQSCSAQAPAAVQPTAATVNVAGAVQPTVTPQAQVKGQAKAAVKAQANAQKQAQKQAQEQAQPSGVLGAVASAPEAIQETATSGTLPFTGIPLWVAVLLGFGLLLTGLGLRRAAEH
jgi:hypothetical protein